jgi:hypothetical protein
MMALGLIRSAMLEAGRLRNVAMAELSFARALIETRLFLKFAVATADPERRPSIWQAFVPCRTRHRVRFQPGCRFPRDRQDYRRKSRGLQKHRPAHRPES